MKGLMKLTRLKGGKNGKIEKELTKQIDKERDIHIWSPTLKTLPEDQDKMSEFGSHP